MHIVLFNIDEYFIDIMFVYFVIITILVNIIFTNRGYEKSLLFLSVGAWQNYSCKKDSFNVYG